jgi:hypothetical protein
MNVQSRRRQGYLVAVIGVLIVLMLCGLPALAIRQRIIPPPQLHIHMGELHVVALITPKMGEPPPVQCQYYPSSCAPPRTYDLYTVWFIDARQVPINPRTAIQKLIAMPLK